MAKSLPRRIQSLARRRLRSRNCADQLLWRETGKVDNKLAQERSERRNAEESSSGSSRCCYETLLLTVSKERDHLDQARRDIEAAFHAKSVVSRALQDQEEHAKGIIEMALEVMEKGRAA